MATENNKEVKKAEEEYEYLTGDEDAKRIAFLKEKYEFDYNSGMHHARKVGLEEGREKGLAEGMEKGEKKGRIEGRIKGREEGEKKGISETKKQTAKKMKEKGIDIESIIEITDLTREEIEKL